MLNDLIYITDGIHLMCLPYCKENLHRMAHDLDIKKSWFHKDHYDIPKKRIEEIKSKCKWIVSPKILVRIRNNNK